MSASCLLADAETQGGGSAMWAKDDQTLLALLASSTDWSKSLFLLLVSFSQLICCNVIAINSKAASPGSYEAILACEGHTIFLFFCGM